jgi:hypothetical protein
MRIDNELWSSVVRELRTVSQHLQLEVGFLAEFPCLSSCPMDHLLFSSIVTVVSSHFEKNCSFFSI